MALSDEQRERWRQHFRTQLAASGGQSGWDWLDNYQPQRPQRPSGLITPPPAGQRLAQSTKVEDTAHHQPAAMVSPPSSAPLRWPQEASELCSQRADDGWVNDPYDLPTISEPYELLGADGRPYFCRGTSRVLRSRGPCVLFELGSNGRQMRTALGMRGALHYPDWREKKIAKGVVKTTAFAQFFPT